MPCVKVKRLSNKMFHIKFYSSRTVKLTGPRRYSGYIVPGPSREHLLIKGPGDFLCTSRQNSCQRPW